jgi:hypothetical protein
LVRRAGVTLTNLLLLVIVAILVRQFLPISAETLVVGAVVGIAIYWGHALIFGYPERRRLKKQAEADETLFWELQKKGDAIRDKYDPRREWNEATVVPDEYLAEIRALNLEYGGVLRRRNGWTDADFDD